MTTTTKWIPGWRQISEDGLQGWVSSQREALAAIKAFEASSSVKFLKDAELKHSDTNDIGPAHKRIRFHDIQDVIPQDGTPFMIVGHARYICIFGRDKHAASKKRDKERKEALLQQGDNPTAKRYYKQVCGTLKQGCKARINVKEVVKFTDFKDCITPSERKSASRKVRQALESGETINSERRIYIKFPGPENHKIHQVSGSRNMPLNKELVEKIHKLVGKGVTNVKKMRRLLEIHVETVLFPDPKTRPPKSSKAFYPSNKCIRNHIYATRKKLSASGIDVTQIEVNSSSDNEVDGECMNFPNVPEGRSIKNQNTAGSVQTSGAMEPRLECIIKLGGSAITRKSEFETPNMENIARAAELVSRLRGKCILVHGAGSFGHFQAKEYGVAKGYSSLPADEQRRVREGFCKTRLSVTMLNHMVVEALAEKGVHAVGVGSCGRWSTRGRGHVATSDCERITDLLQAGFLPVLHGDCVLDGELGCTILSGDTIIQVLCEYFKPKRVVFLSDVDGIFTKPPINSDARLIPKIQVNQDGSIATSIATKQLDHDVTGGIKTKIDLACRIVSQSGGTIPVFICKLEGHSAELACWHGNMRKKFTGTLVV